MTMRTQPSPEDLEQIRDDLRAEIREARGTLKDLRREIKEARTLVPMLTDELFQAEVKKQVDALGEATVTAMDAAVDRVNAKFDGLYDLLTGQDRQSRRTGQPSVPDLLERRAANNTGD
ncbi:MULTISPECIES: hypothetical protein [Streptomyces]